jgi:hypothetical protein
MAVSYSRLNSRVRDKFGIDITYIPAGASGRTVKGIIDRNYFSDTGGAAGIQTESFILQVVNNDIPELAAGDDFTIAGTNYKAVEIRPDFFGMTEIVLNKA